MASNRQKIRRFSEKIALLNKKEAESNAKFEEIIKEVQATRSGHGSQVVTTASSRYNAASSCKKRTSSIEELEEVYQNLIKSCMSDYDENEKHVSQVGLCSSLTNCQDSATQAQDHLSKALRSRSAEPGQRSRDLLEAHQPGPPFSQSTSTTPAINAGTAYLLYPHKGQVLAATLSGSPTNPICSHADSSTSCRNRVASVGSAGHYSRTSNSAQHSSQLDCVPQPNNWNPNANAVTDMHLNPTCDRSWQKSCSDPVLHSPGNHERADDPLCWNDMMTAPMNMEQSGNVGVQLIDGSIECNQQVELGYPVHHHLQAAQTEADKFNYTLEAPGSAANESPVVQLEASCCRQLNTNDCRSLNIARGSSINININNLPGIKICTIDDVDLQLRDSLLECTVQQRETGNKLSDTDNLQFVEKSNCDLQQMTTGIQGCTSLLNSEQYHDSCETQDWSHTVCSNNQPAPSGAQEDLFNASSGCNWIVEGAKTGVTATSNCKDLVDAAPTFMMAMPFSGLTNNISRSRSHNSIDHLAKQRELDKNYSSERISQENRMLERYGGTLALDEFVAQTGLGDRECLSNLSMRPQRGSISPMDSSSNLTSPKSEQNSPKHSLLEYTEYLPFQIFDQ